METFRSLLPFLVPILLLQLTLIIIAMRDLIRRKHTRGPRWIWAIVILFFNILGPVLYLILGRDE